MGLELPCACCYPERRYQKPLVGIAVSVEELVVPQDSRKTVSMRSQCERRQVTFSDFMFPNCKTGGIESQDGRIDKHCVCIIPRIH